MLTGIELIAKERDEHVTKHSINIGMDLLHNTKGQLSVAAGILSQMHIPENMDLIPTDWDKQLWDKMLNKPYKERLIIAGSLIAAELDRLINHNKK